MSTKKILYIVRHAKSSWDYEDISDIDRHLKHRGIRDAYHMARRVKIERDIPEQIICSPAIRALHTANIFLRVFDDGFSKLIINDHLYCSGVSTIKQVISEVDNSICKLMVFGHNPDFSELVSVLSGHTYFDLSTCAVAKLIFETDDWHLISAETLKDFSLDSPKN